MSSQPMMTGACCPKSDDGVTQLFLREGHSVGILGLNTAFEQLWLLDRKPEEATDAELLDMVRAQRNYITPKPDVEALYAAALRRAYASFYTRRIQR